MPESGIKSTLFRVTKQQRLEEHAALMRVEYDRALPPRVRAIIKRAATQHNVRVADVCKRVKGATAVTRARLVAAEQLRCLGMSYPMIGRYLGVHHTSILHLLGVGKPRKPVEISVPDESGVWAI